MHLAVSDQPKRWPRAKALAASRMRPTPRAGAERAPGPCREPRGRAPQGQLRQRQHARPLAQLGARHRQLRAQALGARGGQPRQRVRRRGRILRRPRAPAVKCAGPVVCARCIASAYEQSKACSRLVAEVSTSGRPSTLPPCRTGAGASLVGTTRLLHRRAGRRARRRHAQRPGRARGPCGAAIGDEHLAAGALFAAAGRLAPLGPLNMPAEQH